MKYKKKLKLMPSARDNRRYFLVECSDNGKIENAILKYVGILGLAKSAYFFVEKNGNFVISSCLRESLNDVLASLAYAKIKVLRVSGTIKGLKK
jgi:RNase P/RNase MRP subunit POP5